MILPVYRRVWFGLGAVIETIRVVSAMRHNGRLVIVTFTHGGARDKAGGERYYYQTGGEPGRGHRHDLISFGVVALYANIPKIAQVPRTAG
jgi:hypothetical protein